MRSWIVVTSVVVGACAGAPAEQPAGVPAPQVEQPAPAPAPPEGAAVFTGSTQSGTYDLEVRFDPPSPALGSLFDVVATVRDRRANAPLEAGKVTLDARMPQHNHGMQTDPIDDAGTCDTPADAATTPTCTHPGGVYRTKGFKFHMDGEWTVTVEVLGPNGPDTTSFVVKQP